VSSPSTLTALSFVSSAS